MRALVGLLLGILLTACGAKTEEDDRRTELASCYQSCNRQLAGCPTLKVAKCRDFCSYTLTVNAERPECLEASVELWRCDVEAEWLCGSSDTFATRLDPNACQPEVATHSGLMCR